MSTNSPREDQGLSSRGPTREYRELSLLPSGGPFYVMTCKMADILKFHPEDIGVATMENRVTETSVL